MLTAFHDLPTADQMLHQAHFMLCLLALVIALVPALAAKGGVLHRFGGLVYLPIALFALFVATFMAWRESSSLLFCFNSFCAYLMMSGWRAIYEREEIALIDWVIPGSLFVLALAVLIDLMLHDQGQKGLYLTVFVMNALYLSWRDWVHLKRRALWFKHKNFLGSAGYVGGYAGTSVSIWMERHVAGMVGSVIANLSVVVLTLLPLSLHWLWPVTLVLVSALLALRHRSKKRELRMAMGGY